MSLIRNGCSMCTCRELECGAKVALLVCLEGRFSGTTVRQARGNVVFEEAECYCTTVLSTGGYCFLFPFGGDKLHLPPTAHAHGLMQCKTGASGP